MNSHLWLILLGAGMGVVCFLISIPLRLMLSSRKNRVFREKRRKKIDDLYAKKVATERMSLGLRPIPKERDAINN